MTVDRANYREQRERRVQTMQGMLDRSKRENHALTAAEAAEFDRLDSVVRELGKHTGDTRAIGQSLVETRGALLNDGERRTAEDITFSRYLRTGEIRTSSGLSTSPDNGQMGTDSAGYMIPQSFWLNLQISLK